MARDSARPSGLRLWWEGVNMLVVLPFITARNQLKPTSRIPMSQVAESMLAW